MRVLLKKMKIGISSNLINKSMNEMPKCPNCKNEMVIVWYSEPDEFIGKISS